MRILNNGAELAEYFAQNKKKQTQGARVFRGIHIEGNFDNEGTATDGKIDFRKASNKKYRSLNIYKGEFRTWVLVKGYKETYLANGQIQKIYKGAFREGLLEDINGMFMNIVNRTTKEGRFESGILIEGMYKIFSSNGDLIYFYRGKFKNGHLEDENGLYADVENRIVNEGRFIKGVFIEGIQKMLSASGEVLLLNEGKFKDKALEDGVSISKEVTCQGLFNRGSLAYGEAWYTNGIVQRGFFDGSELTEGLQLFPEGEVLQGTFKGGEIQSGVHYSKQGIIQEGIFGDKGHIDAYQADGKNIVLNISDDITQVGRLEGINFKIISLVQSGIIYRGVFDEDTRCFESGTITYPNGLVEEGTFNEKGLENGVTVLPLEESARMIRVRITHVKNNIPVCSYLNVRPKW